MAIGKREKIFLDDFFGITTDYYLFAVKTVFSLFRFAAKLEHLFSTNFYYLGETFLQDKPDLKFAMLGSQICKEEEVNAVIIENKTSQFDLFNIYKTEKELPFSTLPLFQDDFYIFNNDGLKFYKWEFQNIDYLLLIYTKKEREVEHVFKQLESLSRIKTTNVSAIINDFKRRTDKITFLQQLFCEAEVRNSQFRYEQKRNRLTGRTEIPKQNLCYAERYELLSKVAIDNLDIEVDDNVES